jgi:hypothetical protein
MLKRFLAGLACAVFLVWGLIPLCSELVGYYWPELGADLARHLPR